MAVLGEKVIFVVEKVMFVLNILILLTNIPYYELATCLYVLAHDSANHSTIFTLVVLFTLSIYPVLTILLVAYNRYWVKKKTLEHLGVMILVNLVFWIQVVKVLRNSNLL